MALTPSATSLAFGSITHGTTTSLPLVLTPDVTSDSVYSVQVTGANASLFTTDETFDVPPSGVAKYGNSTVLRNAKTVNVTYSPVTAGTHTGTLEIRYNGVAGAFTILVPLTGTAT